MRLQCGAALTLRAAVPDGFVGDHSSTETRNSLGASDLDGKSFHDLTSCDLEVVAEDMSECSSSDAAW
jgi:hypothetical protein